jgi:hypothetical protein
VNRYLLLGLLAAATPVAAQAQAPAEAPPTGWSVSPGLSETHSPVCSLVGDLGQHRALALVADAARSQLGFLLLFDDGAAQPQPQASASRLTIDASGSRPLSIPGTIRFGQFRSTLDHKSSRHFLHLFNAKSSMTVALSGEPPVSVDLTGTADATKVMKRCEEAQNIPLPAAHQRLAEAATRPRRIAEGPRRVRAVASLHKPAVIAMDDPPPPAIAPSPPADALAAAPPVAAAVPPPAAVPAAPVPVPPVPAAPPAVTALADPAPSVAMATPLPVPMLPAPVSVPAPVPGAINPVTLLIGKAMEVQFVVIVQDATASYRNTGNEIESESARATRAEELCTLLGHDKAADSWPGTIAALPDAQGSGPLSVTLADGITVQTMGAGASGSGDGSMIDQGSALSDALSQMQLGEAVTFSGQFFASDADCVRELSPTQEQSMTAPSFLMKFTAVTAQQ